VKHLITLFLLVSLFSFASARTDKLVTVKADNAKLSRVLQDIARQMNYNIYLTPGLTGPVNTDLKQVPGFGALELILTTQPEKLTYKVLENTIVVGTPERIEKIPDTMFQTK
jgi:type II secretory pathway component HofQ